MPSNQSETTTPGEQPLSFNPEQIKQLVKATYDLPGFASNYFSWTASSHSTRLTYLQNLVSNLPSDGATELRILDLGCGAGIPTTSFLLSQLRNAHVIATDISSTQLSLVAHHLARYIPDSLALLESDMSLLSFPPSSFNAVVATYSLIHLPREEQPLILKRIASWLRSGGLMLVNFGAGEDKGSVDRDWLGEDENGVGGALFWSGWGVEGSLEMVRKSGLDVRVRDVVADEDGPSFLWVLAKKEKVEGET